MARVSGYPSGKKKKKRKLKIGKPSGFYSTLVQRLDSYKENFLFTNSKNNINRSGPDVMTFLPF